MIYKQQIFGCQNSFKVENKFYFYYQHRKDPVPYNGCRGNKASRRACYRNIRTTQERRAAFDFEARPFIRMRRRKMWNSWDDIPYSDWRHNCWKKCTKKKRQWM